MNTSDALFLGAVCLALGVASGYAAGLVMGRAYAGARGGRPPSLPPKADREKFPHTWALLLDPSTGIRYRGCAICGAPDVVAKVRCVGHWTDLAIWCGFRPT